MARKKKFQTKDVPHSSKFGDVSVSKEDESIDQEVLLDSLLESKGLIRKHIPKDGACLFSAISEQIYGSLIFHRRVREKCVNYISENREHFEPFVCVSNLSWEDYLVEMRKPFTWGGQVELQALSLILQKNICIWSIHSSDPTIVDNQFQSSLNLSYYGNHYDCVYTKGKIQLETLCQSIVLDIVDKILGDPIPESREYRNIGLECWKKHSEAIRERDEMITKNLLKSVASPSYKEKKMGWFKKEHDIDDAIAQIIKTEEEELKKLTEAKEFPSLSSNGSKSSTSQTNSSVWVRESRNWNRYFRRFIAVNPHFSIATDLVPFFKKNLDKNVPFCFTPLPEKPSQDSSQNEKQEVKEHNIQPTNDKHFDSPQVKENEAYHSQENEARAVYTHPILPNNPNIYFPPAYGFGGVMHPPTYPPMFPPMLPQNFNPAYWVSENLYM